MLASITLFLSSSSQILKVLLFSLVSTLSMAMILSDKLTVYSNHGFSETLTLLFFSFMFLDILVPKVVVAEYIKSLLSFSIQISSSACDNCFRLRLFTEFSKSIINSKSSFSRKRTFYFNFLTGILFSSVILFDDDLIH